MQTTIPSRASDAGPDDLERNATRPEEANWRDKLWDASDSLRQANRCDTNAWRIVNLTAARNQIDMAIRLLPEGQ